MKLAVELHGTLLGSLEGDSRAFDFSATPEALDVFGVNSTALSVAIPLVPSLPRAHAGRRRNWFAELLPEAHLYDHMLRVAGLRAGDTLGFLARYGRDIAGAVQLWDIDDPTEPRTPELRLLTAVQVKELLEDPIGAPLANAPGTGKSSLPGVQAKIVLARTGDSWAQAIGGWPSTHILKPQLPGALSTMIYDEEYGARITRAVGLAQHSTWIEEFAGLPALVIERYDRVEGQRIHQEDFNQALGASRNQKYQELGGVVSLARVAGVLRASASDQDLRRLAQMMTVSVGLGNMDMHAKNLGLLHDQSGSTHLAPAYDVVPMLQAPGDGRMAMAINGRYRHADITRADLIAEAEAWGLRRAAGVIDRALEEMDDVIRELDPLPDAHPLLHEALTANMARLRR